jgi:hypothetical protein
MLFGRHVVFHGRVTDFRDRQVAAKTGLVKRHGFGTSAVKEQEGSEIHPVRSFLVQLLKVARPTFVRAFCPWYAPADRGALSSIR